MFIGQFRTKYTLKMNRPKQDSVWMLTQNDRRQLDSKHNNNRRPWKDYRGGLGSLCHWSLVDTGGGGRGTCVCVIRAMSLQAAVSVEWRGGWWERGNSDEIGGMTNKQKEISWSWYNLHFYNCTSGTNNEIYNKSDSARQSWNTGQMTNINLLFFFLGCPPTHGVVLVK